MGKSNKNSRKKQKRLEQKQQRLPKLKLAVESNDKQFLESFMSVLGNIPPSEFADMFWRKVPADGRRMIAKHYRHTQRLTNESIQTFKFVSSNVVWDLLHKCVIEESPKLGALNYSIEVYSIKLFHYEVYLSKLEARSTSHGRVYLLPDLRFPANRQLGLSTHALQRMDHRFMMNVMRTRAVALRFPTFLIPYKDDIYSLFINTSDTVKVNDIPSRVFILLGHFPIAEDGDLLVGKTMLKPGFDNTPEHSISDEEMIDYRMLTVIDNVVYRVIAPPTRIYNLRGVPYDMSLNPNIDMLAKIYRMVKP